ncbi:MAG: 50S ribosomal protein L3 N(5)-glutamine methyltransferase [Luminiphilus sp.]
METFGAALKRIMTRLAGANIYCGHGYDSVHDEAVALMLGAARLPPVQSRDLLGEPFPEDAAERLVDLLRGRCEDRRPTAYLLGEAWLAGLSFKCDSRALVPRSPIAQVLLEACQPWWSASQPPRIAVDLCCGGGSLGIIAAHVFPSTTVWLSDIDKAALALARENTQRLGTEERVHCVMGDLLGHFEAQSIDLILANPPYVSATEMAQLPLEYRHEPRGALQADEEGIALAVALLRDAERVLSRRGLLILEVGESFAALENYLPNVPFTWIDLPQGGSGVAAISAQELRDWKAAGAL